LSDRVGSYPKAETTLKARTDRTPVENIIETVKNG
jgi:hypothetical protein